MVWKIVVLVIFVAIAIGVGIYARRSSTSVDGFVLGGRNVGPWLSAFAYGTSYFSAVIFVGYAGQFGWKYGLSATWAGIGNALIGSLLAWWVLGPRAREMTHRLQATTMPEFFGKRYGSQALRIAAAAIIFIFLIPYTASVYNGLSRLIVIAFGINIPYEYCIVFMAVITAIYVVLGGYMATAMNDFIQGCVMVVGIVAVIIAVLNGYGGFSDAVISLSQIPAEGTPLQGAYVSFFGPDLFNLLGVVVLTSLGTWGLPQMVQKFYAIKSGPAIKQGAIISTVFAFIIAGGSYFLGGFGRLATTSTAATYIEYSASGAIVYDSIMPALVSNIPDILLGVLVVMVLSASMSTLSSLVLTSSSTLTLDLIKGNVVKDMTERKQITWMRVLLVVFIALSAFIGIIQVQGSLPFIAQLMAISWGALAGSFLGPFLWGLYKRRVSKAAVWCSFAIGVCLTTGNMISGNALGSPLNIGALAMILSIIVVPLVSTFTPCEVFQIDPPSRKGAGDLAFEAATAGQELSAQTGGRGVEGAAADEIAGLDKKSRQ
ncbi:MAG: sodium:solute symporter family protein [Eggerthellaceae bacterium]|nr:sodium:solute symporter family protein [Eggerthellaceae bacterium]